MSLYKRRLFLFLTGFAAAVTAAALLLLLNVQAIKPRIEAAASAGLGMEVRIKGRLGLSIIRGLGIALNDVTVRRLDADIVTAEKIRIAADLLSLARGRLRIKGVTLINPAFHVVRNMDGRFNFSSAGHPSPAGAFGIKSFSIAEGKLFYSDQRSGRRLEAAGIKISLRDLSYDGKNPGHPLRNVSYTGSASCKTLTAGGFTLTDFAIIAKAGNGVFDIKPDSAHIFGGTGKGSLRADFTGPLARYKAAAELSRFRIENLVRAVSPGVTPRKIIEGTADLSADLTAAGNSGAALKRSLNGTLSLNGENLMFYGLDIDALIPKYERSQNFNLIDVGAFLLAGPFGPALTKSYNFGSLYAESLGGKGAISKFVSVWRVRNGVAEAEDVALSSRKNRLSMKGGLDLNTARFSGVTVAVLNKRGCAVYSQKIEGAFREPHLGKVSMLKSLTGSVSNALEDVWGLVGGCSVIYSGSVAQPD